MFFFCYKQVLDSLNSIGVSELKELEIVREMLSE